MFIFSDFEYKTIFKMGNRFHLFETDLFPIITILYDEFEYIRGGAFPPLGRRLPTIHYIVHLLFQLCTRPGLY